MKKQTVTIGIPAYNEGQNIQRLLRSLLDQQTTEVEIGDIIVVSDGSTDNTVEQARRIYDGKVSIFVEKTRKGKAQAVASIIASSQADVLVLLDADILIKDRLFVDKLTQPIVREGVDLTSAKIAQLPPRNFFQKLLHRSMVAKAKVFEDHNFGDNVYTCHGTSRAMSRRFYQSIDFTKATTGEDAYSYLFCKKMGYRYRHVTTTKLYYQLPMKLVDHERQSVRFFQSKTLLKSIFGEQFVRSEYHLPRLLVARVFVAELFSNPLQALLYTPLFLYMSIRARYIDHTSMLWVIARSTKKLSPSILSIVMVYYRA